MTAFIANDLVQGIPNSPLGGKEEGEGGREEGGRG